MQGGDGNRRLGLVLVVAAVVLAGVGGAAVGLGVPAWLAGAVAAVSALVAGAVVNHIDAGWDRRDDARKRRRQVIDDLRDTGPAGQDDVLGLLLAVRCPMPFRGRSRELTQLAAWRAGEPGCPVMMVSGPAGVGKSRLALEFASRLPQGWAAGWLHAGAGAAAVDAVRACGDPAVIVVDDADGRADLVTLLEALAERHEDPAVRVVLVTRSAAGLRAALTRQLEERHGWIASGAAELDLGTEGGQDDQIRWFAEAVSAFVATLNVPVPILAERFPLGQDGAVEPFVVLQMQALQAVLAAGEDHRDPRDLSSGELAGVLMTHEQRRWRALAATWDWGDGGPPSAAVQGRAIAALALLGASSDAEAAEILRRVPELRDAPAERLAAIGSWIAELYPASPGPAPRIRPDMIGEWFVVTELAAHPELTQSLRTGLTDEQAARALGFLARAADRLEAASRLFEEFAAGDLRRFILAAILAARTGETGSRLLDPVLAAQVGSAGDWTLDQLTELQDTLPAYLLLRTHVTIAHLIVTFHRTLADDNPAAHQASLAAALGNLGTWLDEVGRYREALEAAQEAVTLFRALAADDPAAHQASLATALGNLGNQLDEVGRYREALEAAQEAVTLFRALAADDPAAHQASLATALANLGNQLNKVGRYREALEATQEAVTLRRAVAADDPAAHQASLALTLANLGNQLDEVGRYREALEAAQEAVTLFRALAADDPAAHQASLATALANLGVLLDKAGRYREALEAAQEAVTLRRAVAADDPAAHQASLALALSNLGVLLDKAGRYREALEAAQQAVTLYRALAADNPAAHQASLATALGNLGNRLDEVGRYREALEAAQEAVTLFRALAADDPAAHQASLATALNNLGARLDKAGRYREALEAAQEAVALFRALAADNPAAHQASLATALNNLGNQLDGLGRSTEALAAWTDSVRIYRELASTDPDLYQAEYRRRLTALRQEFDLRGMQYEAIMYDITDPDSASPGQSRAVLRSD